MEPDERSNGRPRDWVLALVLLAGVLASFQGATANDFVNYDDPDYVLENPHVTGGLTGANAVWALTESHASNWHPLTWWSHMLDVELFGLAPAGHHRTSVLLHALNAVLLFLLLRMLALGRGVSFFTAAIFAWHPLRVESVAWVSERKDVLAGLFFFLTLIAYVRYARRPSPLRYGAVALAFALGLMAKPMLVTVPVVLLLLDRWPLERRLAWRRLALEKLPLVGLAAVSVVVTLLAQRGARSTLEALPLGLRLENAAATLGVYAMQTLDPTQLAVFYPHAAITSANPAGDLLVAALFWSVATTALAVWAWRGRGTRPWWLVGLGWTLVMLLPVVGLIQVGVQAHADRYTYLPLIGVVLAVAEAVRRRFDTNAAWRLAALGAGAVGLVACILLTRQQVRVWTDSVTLFEHALAVTDGNYMAHNNLGTELKRRGDSAAARRHFEAALEIHPGFSEGANNLGLMFFEENELEQARLLFERAAAGAPDDPVTQLNLGSVALALGELDTAAEHLRRAEDSGYVHADLDFNLGLLAQYRGRRDEAERRYRAAVEREPDHGQAWSNLGAMQLAEGDPAAAVASFLEVVELDPGDAIGHYNLGYAREQGGDPAGALDSYRKACELAPDLQPARERLRALEQP